ncbi:MAG: 4-hydroxy-tetrahydrodipicolinate reductase [Bacteroidales bacterium]|nr:4-hydroxy-tetrahydrodipicolinate reductase [Bacteroidales bacterium]
MNILIIGYGKMGKMIEQEAIRRNHKIAGIVDVDDSLEDFDVSKADVAIEFTRPESVMKNIEICIKKGLPLVVGTTGWYDRLNEVKSCVADNKASFMYSSNFSVGVYLFRKLNLCLAKMMGDVKGYEPSLTEIHHIHKLDAPSGTAITLAQDLMSVYPQKTTWKLGEVEKDTDLSITSIREGEEFGTHIVSYNSTEDLIEIKHKAKSRKGLASGAVMAAEFLKGKQGFFTMDDMMKNFLN